MRKDIDTIVTPLTIGNNRIQCIEITGDPNLLIISVYLPCKGSPNSQNEFQECIDQLHEQGTLTKKLQISIPQLDSNM